jgi:hypothetical protein
MEPREGKYPTLLTNTPLTRCVHELAALLKKGVGILGKTHPDRVTEPFNATSSAIDECGEGRLCLGLAPRQCGCAALKNRQFFGHCRHLLGIRWQLALKKAQFAFELPLAPQRFSQAP